MVEYPSRSVVNPEGEPFAEPDTAAAPFIDPIGEPPSHAIPAVMVFPAAIEPNVVFINVEPPDATKPVRLLPPDV